MKAWVGCLSVFICFPNGKSMHESFKTPLYSLPTDTVIGQLSIWKADEKTCGIPPYGPLRGMESNFPKTCQGSLGIAHSAYSNKIIPDALALEAAPSSYRGLRSPENSINKA